MFIWFCQIAKRFNTLFRLKEVSIWESIQAKGVKNLLSLCLRAYLGQNIQLSIKPSSLTPSMIPKGF